MNKTTPLPNSLAHLARENAPLHVCTAEVRKLVEFWGFTKNGEDFVKKLVRCHVLKPVKFKHQRGNRFPTAAVLELYQNEQA